MPPLCRRSASEELLAPGSLQLSGFIERSEGLVIDYLAPEDVPQIASTISARCRLSESTVRRHLGDFEALKVLDLVGTRPACWRLSSDTRCKWLMA
jgi:hypothetical protein